MGRTVQVLTRFALACALALAACGRSQLSSPARSDAGVNGRAEICDGLDDDRDGVVDEGYRDARGNYVHASHCGACARACDAPISNALEVTCALFQGVPSCVASSCATGFGPSVAGGCAPLDARLCLPCLDAADCGPLADARCLDIDGARRCSRGCDDDCPDGYACLGGDHCVPRTGSCSCERDGPDFTVACLLDPTLSCSGVARCQDGMQSVCRAPDERCDGVDNDCDGRSDEDFVDVRSVYSVDLQHCGACGADCTLDADAGVPLACGGDPFAPSCVTFCPDREDGLQLGDLLDADRALENGCECTVSALFDAGGERPQDGQLDADCDGADGSVLASIYVSTSGDDSGPGSPTRPMRSIDAAVQRAFASRLRSPRPNVFVASGIYTETITMREGVALYGGYRGDFLARDVDAFEVIVVAPADTAALGGAALVLSGLARTATRVDGLTLRGRDALRPSEPAIGMAVDGSTLLVLRNLRVRAGRPGEGSNGQDGSAGASPFSSAGDGAPPRAAIESAARLCAFNDANRVSGGSGGANFCLGLEVSGGSGGSPWCPSTSNGTAPSGANGSGGVSLAGAGGLGGDDVVGPIEDGVSCPSGVCCGLADFSVPSPFQQAQSGQPGKDGDSGTPGLGCDDPLGQLTAAGLIMEPASPGLRGAPGGGGGGGGAGGGAVMTWIDGQCEFADGLGGGGGGGGAGGCGGGPGGAGQSGGPSVGIFVSSPTQALPVIEAVEITTADGAHGGDGGAGGDGAAGGPGGFGGSVPDALRSTPTLAGPMSGERGGKGGNGGGGGGGGGGCGGSSIGIWITGYAGEAAPVRTQLERDNAFLLGAAGEPGRGGGGWMPAGDGAAGARLEVVLR